GASVRADAIEEAIGEPVLGARPVGRRVRAPDVARAIHDRIVRRHEWLAVDRVAEDLDLARLRVEPLEWACRRRAQADVADDDAPARVHVDPVRRPARLADAAQGPVGENLGAGARLVGGPDAPVAPDDDVLPAPEADAHPLEARERGLGERPSATGRKSGAG